MKRIAIVLFALCRFVDMYGQSGNHRIDSLLRALDAAKGIDRHEPMLAAAIDYWLIDSVEVGLRMTKGAQAIAFTYHDTVKFAFASRILATMLMAMNKQRESLLVLDTVMPFLMRPDMKRERAAMLNIKGLTLIWAVKFDQALTSFFTALGLYRDLGHSRGISIVLNNVGLVYYKLKSHRKALRYFRQSVSLKKKVEFNHDLDLALMNIAHCYANLGVSDSAIYFVGEAMDACGDHCSEVRMVESDYVNGVVQFGLKHFGESAQYFTQSYRRAMEIGHTRFQLDNLVFLSKISRESGDLANAATYLGEAETLIETGTADNLEIIKIYKESSDLYLMQKDFRRAARFQAKYIQLKDSLYDEELTSNLMVIHAEFAERENRAELKTQEAILLLDARIIAEQRRVNVAMAGLAVALMILGVVLWKAYSSKRRVNHLLEERVSERTREIESSMRSFLQASREREQRIRKAQTTLRAALANIQGLCELGMREVPEGPVAEYLSEMARASKELSDQVPLWLMAEADEDIIGS